MGRVPLRARKAFIAANGEGPWPCAYENCDELVMQIGVCRIDGDVHHVDEDITNDAPENLQVMHTRCHQRYHHAGRTHSPEHNAKVGRKGRVFTPEWRAKLTARQLTRVKCPDCDYVHTPQYVGRHRKAMHAHGD